MSSSDSQRQDSMARRSWQQDRRSFPLHNNVMSPRFVSGSGGGAAPSSANHNKPPQGFRGLMADDDLVSSVVPPVTVVLDGRSICQRISLHKHGSYQSLAKALRQMFVDGNDGGGTSETDLDLSNAIPGHLIAYEDMENDLLLAGDLNWKDFVRVAKRIRILPAKGNARKERGEA